jgi:hypothetical protein
MAAVGGSREDGPREFRLDRQALAVTVRADAERSNRPLAYWRSRPVEERTAAVEFLRRQFIGPGARLQRVLRVTERSRPLVRDRRRVRSLPFIDRETFLRNKRAAGRPKDLADIEALKESS